MRSGEAVISANMLGLEFAVMWNRKSFRLIIERVGAKNKKQLEGQFERRVWGGEMVPIRP